MKCFITAKDGLLWRDGKIIPLPEADVVAREYGYSCAEAMVRALERVSYPLIGGPCCGMTVESRPMPEGHRFLARNLFSSDVHIYEHRGGEAFCLPKETAI